MPTINLNTNTRSRVPTISKKEAQEIYNTTRWKRLRAWYLRNHPLCEDCLEKDPEVLTPTDEVHHKIPFSKGKTKEERQALAYDPDNLRSLCVDCHKAIHGNVHPGLIE